MRFTLPIPPPLSACFRNARGPGRVKTERYKRWITEAGWMLKTQHLNGVYNNDLGRNVVKRNLSSVYVLLVLHPKKGSDIDNRFKPVMDLLSKMEVIKDDSCPHVLGVIGYWDTECPKDETIVIIKDSLEELIDAATETRTVPNNDDSNEAPG